MLWGTVGMLTFLVCVQGYRLLIGSLPTGYLGMIVIGLLVGTTAGMMSYFAEPRLAAKGRT
ncbi:hypothetical protein [Halohasta litchfieldiae]|uniref:hypothetical protein n=1 Tax=Halohasta litchfieldiae TaxID=1073996 RepID=UPI00223FA7C3|nr:hypothetical protein [Halohasta litchfieldiae]